jgi:hypothetical protein
MGKNWNTGQVATLLWDKAFGSCNDCVSFIIHNGIKTWH